MGKRKRTYFRDSIIDKRSYYNTYFNLLLEIAQSVFVYENLPEEIDPLFLERLLVYHGKAAFFKDPVMNYCVMKFAHGGTLGVYRNPTSINVIADNGYNAHLGTDYFKAVALMESGNGEFVNEYDSFVIIYNNRLRAPIDVNLMQYAERLAELDMTIDVNNHAQKTPIVITGEDKQILTLENLYMNYAGNKPVMFGYKGLDINALNVLKTDAPYVAPQIYEMKSQIWNEALTFLGIPNISQEKKERMVSDEVLRMQGGVLSIRNSRLETRKQAVEQINKLFGLNLNVRYAVDFEDMMKNKSENAGEEQAESGGENDGEVFNEDELVGVE